MPGNAYHFSGRGNRGHVRWVQKLWERVRERAGLPDLQIRDLRHTAGGWLAQLGASQYATRDVLEHADSATTQPGLRTSTRSATWRGPRQRRWAGR